MNEKTSPAHSDDDPGLAARQARLGLVLFFLYTAGYAGFMGLSAFAPEMMARPVLGGVNLAIIYGLGLIFGAFALAVLYMLLSSGNARRFEEKR